MKVAGRLDAICSSISEAGPTRARRSRGWCRRISSSGFNRPRRRSSQARCAAWGCGVETAGTPGSGDPTDRVDPEQTSVVRQAAALQTDARARRDRAKALFDQGLLPRADLDAAEATYQVADSQYSGCARRGRQPPGHPRAAPLRARPRTPAAHRFGAPGAVRRRGARAPGDSPGSTSRSVSRWSPWCACIRSGCKLAVPERAGRQAASRAGGASAPSMATRAPTPARVARLSPAIDESNRTLMLEAEVPNADGALRPGSFASAEIVTAADQPVVLVPSERDRHLRRHREGSGGRERPGRSSGKRVRTGRPVRRSGRDHRGPRRRRPRRDRARATWWAARQ